MKYNVMNNNYNKVMKKDNSFIEINSVIKVNTNGFSILGQIQVFTKGGSMKGTAEGGGGGPGACSSEQVWNF